ncbi:unnamed protein product [Trichogramma brassicae]|uniref:Uncharacterized protein n=1 Tax=Trichogramma brassicae TaxID=86971 RepID=A0A6H5IWZ0_9HYME|nr:unnamed protein product [Trichogramma brassicae]
MDLLSRNNVYIHRCFNSLYCPFARCCNSYMAVLLPLLSTYLARLFTHLSSDYSKIRARLCPGDRVAFLLTAQALLQHRAVDDAQQKWFEKYVCSRLGTPHEIHLDLLCHGRDDEESIYRVEHATFWLMALTLVHDGRMEYEQEFLFTMYIEDMLERYETTYSGPQCHVENWEPEEDGVCPICQRRFSEAPPTIGPWYIL